MFFFKKKKNKRGKRGVKSGKDKKQLTAHSDKNQRVQIRSQNPDDQTNVYNIHHKTPKTSLSTPTLYIYTHTNTRSHKQTSPPLVLHNTRKQRRASPFLSLQASTVLSLQKQTWISLAPPLKGMLLLLRLLGSIDRSIYFLNLNLFLRMRYLSFWLQIQCNES